MRKKCKPILTISMLWECNKCKHKWYATVNDRTNGHNCNECADEIRADSIRKVRTTVENSLSTWCLENPVQCQILIEQWTGISEDGKQYTMDEVSYSSHIKMLWRCANGHEWYAIILKESIRFRAVKRADLLSEINLL